MNTNSNSITITTKRCQLIAPIVLTKDCRATVPLLLNNDPNALKAKAEEAFYYDIADSLYRGASYLKVDEKSDIEFDAHGNVLNPGAFLTDEEWDCMYKEFKDSFPNGDASLEDASRWFSENYDPDGLFYKNSGINEAIDILAELLGCE